MMRQLKFISPTLMPTPGRPVNTVRNGDKWGNLEQHEQVEIWVCAHPHSGDCPYVEPGSSDADGESCTMLGVADILLPPWVGTFLDIPARFLHRHHCGSISYPELRAGMESVYGENFGVYGVVTVIDFKLT
jgi:hypothetical protein